MWGQDLGIPLRNLQLRILQRFLQENSTEQEELCLLKRIAVPGDNSNQEEMSGLQIREVLENGNETRRYVGYHVKTFG